MILPDSNRPNKAYALRYASEGYKVFPCRNKEPLTAHGFLDATTDPNQIITWWNKFPDAQIGLATNEHFIIDIDPKNGGDKTLADYEAKYGKMPLTPTALTNSK